MLYLAYNTRASVEGGRDQEGDEHQAALSSATTTGTTLLKVNRLVKLRDHPTKQSFRNFSVAAHCAELSSICCRLLPLLRPHNLNLAPHLARNLSATCQRPIYRTSTTCLFPCDVSATHLRPVYRSRHVYGTGTCSMCLLDTFCLQTAQTLQIPKTSPCPPQATAESRSS